MYPISIKYVAKKLALTGKYDYPLITFEYKPFLFLVTKVLKSAATAATSTLKCATC